MTMAEKITALRRSKGWSQEELAEKLDVTRQSVSKWEGGQSVPDLERVLRMSELFGVSTDRLLKDSEEIQGLTVEAGEPLRRLSLEEAEAFLEAKNTNAPKIALATMCVILAVIPLLLLTGLADVGVLPLPEEAAGGIGFAALVLVVALAVRTYVLCGSRTARFVWIEQEGFAAEPEVIRLVQEKQDVMRERRGRSNALATCLCVLSALPILSLSFCGDAVAILCACVVVALCAVAVRLFIVVNMPWINLEKLVQRGDYSVENKLRNKRLGGFSVVYWSVAVIGFLVMTFGFRVQWDRAWLYWAVAGILFGAATVVAGAFGKKAK